MMPVIGQLLQKGVPQQYLVAAGMLGFFFFCFWGYKIITPDTSRENFFWMLMLRGVAMGMLFIPITALSLSTLKGRQIGDGAAFTGMMRQLGGSFGIAAITTFMASQNMVHRSDLVNKLDVTSPAIQNRVAALEHNFIVKGIAPNIAKQDAYKMLDYSVAKQAMVLSYMDVFLFLGILFLVSVPFVLMVKRNKGKKLSMADAAH